MHLEFRLLKQSLNKRWDLFAHENALILNSTNWLTMMVESLGPRLVSHPTPGYKEAVSRFLPPPFAPKGG